MTVRKFFLLTLLVLVLLAGLDRTLGLIEHKKPLSFRSIRLKENIPNTDLWLGVAPDLSELSDSLEHKRFHFRTDGEGFVIPSFRYAKPDLTLVFLGGSTTECFYVEEDKRFPYAVALELEKRYGLKVNSLNGGVGGNHSMHSNDILLNKIIPLKPDIVCLKHNINDWVVLTLEQTYWNHHFRRSLVVVDEASVLAKSLLFVRYKLFRNLGDWFFSQPWLEGLFKPLRYRGADEFARLRGKKIVADETRMLDDFRKSLQTFIALCRIHEMTPVLLTQANRLTDDPDPVVVKWCSILERDFGIPYVEFKKRIGDFNKCVRRVAAEERVTLIDLEKQIPKTKENMFDIVHYNDTGSLLAARCIADGLSATSVLSGRPVAAGKGIAARGNEQA